MLRNVDLADLEVLGAKMKRGTDHHWQLVQYKYDIAIYALCKCGYHYACSGNKRNDDGSFSLEQVVDPCRLFPYCPVCGARKKTYSTEVVRKECSPWSTKII